MDYKLASIENNARVLGEINRGVDPEVLTDIGHKLVEACDTHTALIPTPSRQQLTTHPRPAKRLYGRAQSANDVASEKSQRAPFPYGNSDIDSYTQD